MTTHPRIPALALALALASGVVFAHGDDHGRQGGAATAGKAATAAGSAGDPAKASRTVEIDMTDAMRFAPAELAVRRGETVRFLVRNRGVIMHEMVIGTMDELKEHAEVMKASGGMAHDAANIAHVQPGARGEVVWRFDRAGTFHFACLIPGHFEAGMVGRVTVR